VEEFNFLQSLPAIVPEIGLALTAILVMALDNGFPGLFKGLPESRRKIIAWVTAISLLATALLYVVFWHPTEATTGLYWGGMVRHDTLAEIFKVMVLIAGALTALMAVDVRGLGRKGEFYLIVIVSSLGACLISGAADLIMVFLGLETVTIPLYILAGFRRDDSKSAESGMKYFLFGSFASALLLYGLSLLYGFSGQTNLYEIARYLASPEFSPNAVPVLGAIALIVAGFGFKISAVPFHFWTPDVYEGAPTPVTAFLSVASKAASFALLVRFFSAVFPETVVLNGIEVKDFWVQLATALAVISMTVGNVIALAQRNIKRLLAYSSIAQAGYTLVGVAALQATTLATPEQALLAQEQAVAAIIFYMFMYTFTNLLAFAVVVLVGNATGSDEISDLAGLSRRSPWLALTMTVALLSLGGVPPAAGFFGKFFLFQAAVNSGLVWLAMLGVLNSIVALYYYLVVVKVMYVDRGQNEDKPIPVSPAYVWVLGATTVIVIIIGSFGVQPIFDWALRGAAALFGSA
jgi:NADH-quinone oxidoreductase subunit N